MGAEVIVIAVVVLLVGLPIWVNSRRKQRGEVRLHSSSAIAMVVILAVAASVALIATSLDALSPGSILSLLSLVALWISLLVMLSRGVSGEGAGAAPTTADPDGQYVGGANPKSVAPGSNRPVVSWLEIAAQVAGILSLAISVITLLTN